MSSRKKKRTRVLRGVAGVAISGLLIGWIVGRADMAALAGALAGTRLGWLTMAFVMFGAGIALASARWGLPLAVSGLSESGAFVLRVACVGHCFNMLLMGPVGGDIVKAALYARWTGRSGARTLATCAVDRLLAGGGSVVYGILIVLLIVFCGGMERLSSLQLTGPAWRGPALLAALVALAIWVFRDRFRGSEFLRQSWNSFREVFRRFGGSRRLPVLGVALSLLNQIVWTSVLAICLYAVAGGDVAWGETLWVFPIVSTVAALPISVAGAGVREGAAVFLLQTCDVPAAQALAAALLTSGVYLAWAILGALIGWREEMASERGE
jgi:uncharacterized membrane protein YbhN (UPF0104 family)